MQMNQTLLVGYNYIKPHWLERVFVGDTLKSEAKEDKRSPGARF